MDIEKRYLRRKGKDSSHDFVTFRFVSSFVIFKIGLKMPRRYNYRAMADPLSVLPALDCYGCRYKTLSATSRIYFTLAS